MRPTKELGDFIKGLKKALKTYSATQRDQYSWIAKTDDRFIFTVELDHKDKENNRYNHLNGIFEKKVRPLSTENGDAALTVSHGKELFEAAQETYKSKAYCKLLLVRGTKYGTDSGGVRAVMDHDLWKFTKFNGSLEAGFEFVIERSA